MTSSSSPDELARALAAAEHAGQIAVARSSAAADAGMARVYDLSRVVSTAMRETVRLAELERGLSAAAPSAERRLRVLGDVAALCIGKVAIDGTAQVMRSDLGIKDSQ